MIPYAEMRILGAMLRDHDTAAQLVEEGALRPTDFVTAGEPDCRPGGV